MIFPRKGAKRGMETCLFFYFFFFNLFYVF